MTCNLDKAWNNAEAAMKAMFEAGFHHEGEIPEGYKIDFRDHITDIWHMYQNVKRINDSRKEQCPGFDDNIDTDDDGVADGCDDCPLDVNDDSDGDGSFR